MDISTAGSISPSAPGLLIRVVRQPAALIGIVCIAIFVFAALCAPLLTPYDPYVGHLSDRMQPPSGAHLMGTDLQGRDNFTRILYGARISLQVGVLAVGFGLVLGGALGVLAGFGGIADTLVMRLVDIFLSIPSILLAIGLVSWMGRGELQVMLAIGIAYAPKFARLLRGSLLAVRNADYVLAAKAGGATRLKILLRHMLPNSLTPLTVQATLAVATAIIDAAALGFLGLGSGDPRIPEWGAMLTGSARFLQSAPYLILFPGAAIVFSVIGFNLVGDGLRQALDPRLRH